MKRTIALMLALIMVVSLGLAGCGTKDGGSKAEKAITVNLASEPPELDPQLTTDTTSFAVLNSVMDGLVRLNSKQEPTTNGAAEKWDISSDGLTYTFHLRKNMKYSNGDTVKAQDYAYAIQRAVDPETASEYAYIFDNIKNATAIYSGEKPVSDLGVKVVNDTTLEITLGAAAPYFLTIMAFGTSLPCQEKFYTANKEKYGAEADKLIYNGPFVIDSWTHDDNIVLKKNENYWNKDKIKLDKITMLMISDSNTAITAFYNGELDMVGVPGARRSSVMSEGYTLEKYSDGSTWYLECNLENKFLKNKDLRLAISAIIDREDYVATAVKNESIPATGFVPTDFPGLSKDFRDESGALLETKANPTKAKEYLDKALASLGVKASDITLELITDEGDVAKDSATVLQEMIQSGLGINLTITQMPFKSRLQKMTDKDFGICSAGWGPDYFDAMSFLDLWITDGGNNHTYWSNADYDKLIADAKVESDATKRMEMLYDAEKILMEEAPIIMTYFRYREWTKIDKLKGVIRSSVGGDPDFYEAYLED